jgi:hypothetical protein
LSIIRHFPLNLVYSATILTFSLWLLHFCFPFFTIKMTQVLVILLAS